MQHALGWTITDALRLLEVITKNTKEYLNIAIFRQRELATGGLSATTWTRMVPYFVHSKDEVNEGYSSPRDATKATLVNRPLLRGSNGTLIRLPASLLGPAFFEAISIALRNAGYPGPDDKVLPTALENAIADFFRNRRYKVDHVAKTYKMLDPLTGKQIAGECDVVVETLNHIVFLEAKKKPLTRVSQTGDVLANLIDMSDSLLYAQSQAATHERLLRHHRHLRFDDGSRLELGTRHVDRIAVILARPRMHSGSAVNQDGVSGFSGCDCEGRSTNNDRTSRCA